MSTSILQSVTQGKSVGIRVRRILWRVTVYVLLFAMVFVALLPLIWMVSTSLKPGYIEAYSLKLFPSKATWSNYPYTWKRVGFPKYLKNSIFITSAALFGSLLSASVTGFAFARLKFPGRNIWFAILLLTMMIPPAIMIIPQYLLYNWLRWLDSYKPLIIPWFFGGGAFRIFLFRQFVKSIPEELDQAAEIDGCSNLRIFAQIIVPLMMPAVATAAVLGFMGFWNDFFSPFIYLHSAEKDTIVLRLYRIWMDTEGYMREEMHTVMAGNVMVTFPGFLIFFIAQKRFIQGIVTTGIKG